MRTTDSKLSDILETMEKLFSSKYGIANFNAEQTLSTSGSQSRDYNYDFGNVIPMNRFTVGSSKNEIWRGHASSLCKTRSRVRGYGEFIERYCSAYVEHEKLAKLIFGSYSEFIEKDCIDLSVFLPFEDSQYDNPEFPFPKYSSKSKISWIEGSDIISGRSVWLPAQKMFLTYPYPSDELLYNCGLSNGLACGSSPNHAILSGIYEVVERDSFMLTWLLKLPGIRIEVVDPKNEDLANLYNHIMKHISGEDKLFVYDISRTDGIYTILTCIRNDLPDAFGLIVATASHLDPEMALFKSLEELCQIQEYAYAELFGNESKKYQHLKINEIDCLEKHLLYYSTGRRSRAFDFISLGNMSVNLKDMLNHSTGTDSNYLKQIIDLFGKKKHSIYIADLTRPEISVCGFSVLKTAIPDYLELEIFQSAKHLKNTRLNKLQKEFGVELNTEPHPFA